MQNRTTRPSVPSAAPDPRNQEIRRRVKGLAERAIDADGADAKSSQRLVCHGMHRDEDQGRVLAGNRLSRHQLRRLSLDLLNQHARLSHQGPQLPALLDGFARVQPVLQCVLVAAWSARPRGAAMHATASFPDSPPETCTACPTESWRHSAGSTASDRCCANARRSFTLICAALESEHAPCLLR